MPRAVVGCAECPDGVHVSAAHPWRVLVRLRWCSVDRVAFSLPFEGEHIYVRVLTGLPSAVVREMRKRVGSAQPYLHAHCNIGEHRLSRRVFSDWECR